MSVLIREEDYHELISFILDEIWDEEEWELNYRAFPEILCRKLSKMGYVRYDEESGSYERTDYMS